MKSSFILSTGSYLPENRVANEALTQFPSGTAEVIAQKTGIVSRRFAAPDQCTSDMAICAAVDCLEKGDVSAREIDAIIVATSSPDRIQPATATRVQHLLDAENAFAFDINSVCSGSTYGIFLADAIIKAGQVKTVLLVGAEMYSKLLNPKDFSTFPFFGDGAGAVLFTTGRRGEGVLHSCLETDGSQDHVIQVPAGGSMKPYTGLKHPRDLFFKMNGKKVFSFAVEQGTHIILKLLEETGFRPRDIDCFIAHQANIHIIQKIADNIHVAHDRFFINLYDHGNTAGASVLIALDEAISSRMIKRGDLVLTVAFGGGLSWGANLIGY